MGKLARINAFRMGGKKASNSQSSIARHSTSTGGDPNKLGKSSGKARGGKTKSTSVKRGR